MTDKEKLQWLRDKVEEAEQQLETMNKAVNRVEGWRQFAADTLRQYQKWLAELEAQEAEK